MKELVNSSKDALDLELCWLPNCNVDKDPFTIPALQVTCMDAVCHVVFIHCDVAYTHSWFQNDCMFKISCENLELEILGNPQIQTGCDRTALP